MFSVTLTDLFSSLVLCIIYGLKLGSIKRKIIGLGYFCSDSGWLGGTLLIVLKLNP